MPQYGCTPKGFNETRTGRPQFQCVASGLSPPTVHNCNLLQINNLQYVQHVCMPVQSVRERIRNTFHFQGMPNATVEEMVKNAEIHVQMSKSCAYHNKKWLGIFMDHDTATHFLFRDRGKLYAYIWSFVHDPEMAEDVFQDVCLLTIRECQKIESESHIQSWFRRVARQRAIDCLRRRQRAPMILDSAVLDVLESHWAREDATPMPTLTTALQRCVEMLTSRAREIVKLRYVDGLSVAKVAAMLGAQADTMYKSLWRIHHKLGACVKNRMSQEGEQVDHA